MPRPQDSRISDRTHAVLSSAVKAEGRKAFAVRAGVSESTLERALTWALVSSMSRRLIEIALNERNEQELPPAA